MAGFKPAGVEVEKSETESPGPVKSRQDEADEKELNRWLAWSGDGMKPTPENPELKDALQFERAEKEERDALRRRVLRWALGIPLLFSYLWVGFLSPLLYVLSPVMMLLGSILIAPDISGFFSESFGHLLWPKHEIEPRPLYSVPESLAVSGRYEEAEREYEKIIQEFPNEVKPHVDLINIAVLRLNDAELAEQLYRRGMGIIEKKEARERLTAMYDGIRQRLKSKDKKTRIVAFVPKENKSADVPSIGVDQGWEGRPSRHRKHGSAPDRVL